MTTTEIEKDSTHPIRDFVHAMQKEFGKCEFRAVSQDGIVVQTPGWDRVSHPTKEMGDSLVHKVK